MCISWRGPRHKFRGPSLLNDHACWWDLVACHQATCQVCTSSGWLYYYKLPHHDTESEENSDNDMRRGESKPTPSGTIDGGCSFPSTDNRLGPENVNPEYTKFETRQDRVFWMLLYNYYPASVMTGCCVLFRVQKVPQ